MRPNEFFAAMQSLERESMNDPFGATVRAEKLVEDYLYSNGLAPGLESYQRIKRRYLTITDMGDGDERPGT